MNSPTSSNGGSTKAEKSRIIGVSACVATLLVVGLACGLFLFLNEGGKVTVQDGTNGQALVEPIAQELLGDNLPFDIDGVAYRAGVVEVKEGVQEWTPSDCWEFGGDYAQIGSLPVSSDSVFGSETKDPTNLRSYYPAYIGPDLASGLGEGDPNMIDGRYYEPQDGSGTQNTLIWRSALLDSEIYQGVDNWAIQYWDADDNEIRTLGTALALNGEDTPQTYGEVVPTFNGDNAYFASHTKEGGKWVPSIISFDIDSPMSSVKIAEGNYPAAVKNGVIYASDLRDSTQPGSYTKLCRNDGSRESEVFRVTNSDEWGITGIWATSDYRAVCLTADDVAMGSYIGLWRGDFDEPLIWVHVMSPTVIATMNNGWFVWGSGSQAENSGMYAYSWETGETLYLGDAPGYSRPAVAREDNTVMVPFYRDELSPLSFRVYELPQGPSGDEGGSS